MKTREAFIALIILIPVALVISLFPACMFLCFDDYLAEHLGLPWIGEAGFWRVYAFFCVLAFLIRGVRGDYSDDRGGA